MAETPFYPLGALDFAAMIQPAYRGVGRGAGAPAPEPAGGVATDPGLEFVGGVAGVPAPGVAGDVVPAPADGRERTLSSNVVAASTQARMDSFWSHRTARRVSPLWSKKPAPRWC